MFRQWFGASGMPQGSWTEFDPPARHKAGCKCAACEVERRRNEIFAERERAREAKRREAVRMIAAAKERAKDEAARTAHERLVEEKVQLRQEQERAANAKARRQHAAAALDALLQSAPAVAAASSLPLDDLLDTFAALSAARDKVRRAFNDCDSKLPGAAQDKAMEGRDLLIGDLLAHAERRLDSLADAAEAAAAAAAAAAEATVVDGTDATVPTDLTDPRPPLAAPAAAPPAGGRGGTRKQRKQRSAAAGLQAMADLAAARTPEELEAAIEVAEGLRVGGSDLTFALEEARERLERIT